MENNKSSEIIIYRTPTSKHSIEVMFDLDTFWLTQKRISELFDVEVNTVNYHLKEVFKSKELNEDSTIRKIRIIQTEGMRDVNRFGN
jgi:hypothetical protein